MSRTRRALGRGVGGGGGGSEGGCTTPRRATLADRVYELSSKLGALRRRSVLGVDALRSSAEGVPELEQALEPLLAALEAGLAECHQADFAAVFGHPMTSSQGLLMPSPADRKERGSVRGGGGSGGRGGGGTLDATKHLARAISALESDVSAAEAVAKHGYAFRTIAKWAARQSTASTPAASSLPPRASVLALSRPIHATRSVSAAGGGGSGGGGGGNDGRRGASCGGCIDRGGEEDEGDGEGKDLDDPGDDWTMRVFRARAASARDAGRGGSGGGGRGGAHRSSGRERGNRRAASGAAAAAPGAARALECVSAPPGLVVVKALSVPLPPVLVPWSVPMASGDRIGPSTTAAAAAAAATAAAGARGQGERGSASVHGDTAIVGRERSVWRRRGPLSWLGVGGGFQRAGRPASAAAELPPPPPSRPTEPPPPRVVVRVVYAAHALDMLRLAEAATAGATTGGRGADGEQPGRCGSEDARASSASVELLRSEVRAQPVDGTGGSATCTRQGSGGDGEEFAGDDGEDPRPPTSGGPAMQLQVVLRLRTPTSVVVSRLLHSGGHVLTPPRGGPSESTPSCALPTPPVHRAPTGGARATGSVTSRGARRGRGERTRGGGEKERPTGTGDGSVGAGDDRANSGLPTDVRPGGRGGGDGGEGKGDVVPSAWGEAPAGLFPPGGGGGDGACEAGTDHLLGVNIVLPSPPPPPPPPPPPAPPGGRGSHRKISTSNTASTNAETMALPQHPLPRAAPDPSTLSGAAVDSHGDDQRRQRAASRTGVPPGSASGKKRPRPEVGGVAGRGGGVAKARRLGEGEGGMIPSAACAGDGDGGSASGDDKENAARENNSDNNRRRRAEWGWGFLRLWRRAGGAERGGGEDGNTDGGGGGGGGGETSVAAGAAVPAERGASTTEPRGSDGSRQSQQQPLLDLGSAKDGDMEERREEEGEEEEDEEEEEEDDPLGRRSRATAPPALRRSTLVITVVLAPPPPILPDELATVDARASR